MILRPDPEQLVDKALTDVLDTCEVDVDLGELIKAGEQMR